MIMASPASVPIGWSFGTRLGRRDAAPAVVWLQLRRLDEAWYGVPVGSTGGREIQRHGTGRAHVGVTRRAVDMPPLIPGAVCGTRTLDTAMGASGC